MTDTPLYENGNFWVRREQFGSGRFKPKSDGFAVYENSITHAKCVAVIGHAGQVGLDKAKAEVDRRAAQCER